MLSSRIALAIGFFLEILPAYTASDVTCLSKISNSSDEDVVLSFVATEFDYLVIGDTFLTSAYSLSDAFYSLKEGVRRGLPWPHGMRSFIVYSIRDKADSSRLADDPRLTVGILEAGNFYFDDPVVDIPGGVYC